MIQFIKIIFFLFSTFSLAQTNPEKILNGKVISDYVDNNGIYVINLKNQNVSIAKTDDYFEESFFTNKLKIPLEYFKGFQFFIVKNSGYSNAIKAKNKTLAQFMMDELALKYLDLISEKKL